MFCFSIQRGTHLSQLMASLNILMLYQLPTAISHKCFRKGQFNCQRTVSNVRNARSLFSSKEINKRWGSPQKWQRAKHHGFGSLLHFPCQKPLSSSLNPITLETPFKSYKIYWMQKHQHSNAFQVFKAKPFVSHLLSAATLGTPSCATARIL